MEKIYCFGNEFLNQDSLAKKLADELEIEGFEFVKVNDIFQIIGKEKDIVILDVVQGIKKTIKITDISQLKKEKKITAHDFDLADLIKILNSVENINFTIIGIPQKGDKETIKDQITKLIK